MKNQINQLLATKGRKLLFFHQDADGVSSAALILRVYPDFEYHAREGPQVEEKFAKWVVEKKPELVVFLDMPMDQEHESIERLANALPETRFVIIDHHIPEKDMNREQIIHYNPRFKDPKAYKPTSYIVYRILEDSHKMEELMWIAALGVIGDYAMKERKDFLGECKKRFPQLVDTEISEKIFESKLGEATKLISSAITLKGLKGAKYALKTLAEAYGFEWFARDERLQEWHSIVLKEIEKEVKQFEKEKERASNVLIYSTESRMNIVSVVSSILARHYPDRIILLSKKSESGWKLSLRYQNSEINLGQVTKESCRGNGIGGGHEKAAGALVKDFGKFREAFLERLKKE